MTRQGEAVADALRAEQQRVEQVAVRVGADVERLAAVEEEGDLDVGRLAEGLKLQELAGEGFERLAFALLADEVEAWEPVVVVVSSGLSGLQKNKHGECLTGNILGKSLVFLELEALHESAFNLLLAE